MRTLGFLGFVILILIEWYYTKVNARKACEALYNNLKKDETKFKQMTSTMISKKTLPLNNNIISPNSGVYMIVNDKLGLRVETINGKKKQTILENQYNGLIKKLQRNNPTYKYSFHSYSLFYKLPDAYGNIILKIDNN